MKIVPVTDIQWKEPSHASEIALFGGLKQLEPFTTELRFDINPPSDALTSVEFQMQTIGPIKRIGRLYYAFDAWVFGREQRVELFFPLDRRQARRLARRLKRKFRYRQGEVRWRKT